MISLFGAYRTEGEGSPRPLVVELFMPRAERSLGAVIRALGAGRELPAVVRGEGVSAAAPATAELALGRGAVECRVRFADDRGAPRRIVVRARPGLRSPRSWTELEGVLEAPGGPPLARVMLRLNWRALRPGR
jgi:hypothetical protein